MTWASRGSHALTGLIVLGLTALCVLLMSLLGFVAAASVWLVLLPIVERLQALR